MEGHGGLGKPVLEVSLTTRCKEVCGMKGLRKFHWSKSLAKRMAQPFLLNVGLFLSRSHLAILQQAFWEQLSEHTPQCAGLPGHCRLHTYGSDLAAWCYKHKWFYNGSCGQLALQTTFLAFCKYLLFSSLQQYMSLFLNFHKLFLLCVNKDLFLLLLGFVSCFVHSQAITVKGTNISVK